ncbi:Uncharacterised protein [Enterobacter hormaechei]|nr:Uncharacterised protein [Enterobacter hormaechei]
MKLTENRVDTLIDTLNDLICDEQSITRELILPTNSGHTTK